MAHTTQEDRKTNSLDRESYSFHGSPLYFPTTLSRFLLLSVSSTFAFVVVEMLVCVGLSLNCTQPYMRDSWGTFDE